MICSYQSFISLYDVKRCAHVANTVATSLRGLGLIGPLRTFAQVAANGNSDEGFSMRASARGFGEGLTVARVDKPLKEEAVGCWVVTYGESARPL